MKYLRKFFESFGDSNTKEKLQKFCNENLAYLLDEGYQVRVIWTPNCNAWRLVFEKVKREAAHLRDSERINSFYWREVKDDFLPFFEMLDSKYEICGTFNNHWIPSYQKDIKDELVVDFETPKYLVQHTHFFYNKKQLLSSNVTRKKISNIVIYINNNNII
jgi:hypothetical protein